MLFLRCFTSAPRERKRKRKTRGQSGDYRDEGKREGGGRKREKKGKGLVIGEDETK